MIRRGSRKRDHRNVKAHNARAAADVDVHRVTGQESTLYRIDRYDLIAQKTYHFREIDVNRFPYL